MRDPRLVIQRALLSEKGGILKEKENKYFFMVAKDANKIEIKKAVESLFKVKVKDVKTMINHGKVKKVRFGLEGPRSDWKKAIVKLEKDNSIEIFEAV